MYWEKLNDDWYFKRSTFMAMQAMTEGSFGETVQLPHDYMIGGEVRRDAPAGAAMGYYTDGAATYTKLLTIPAAWQGERVELYFDGAMMNASVAVNGSFCALHHYGYTPFYVDITDRVRCGESNRITVVLNPSMQPNSRWYTGAGLFRGVKIGHGAPVHIAADGIFVYTQRIEDVRRADADVVRQAARSSKEAASGEDTEVGGDIAGRAYLVAEVTVENHLPVDRRVRVEAVVTEAQAALDKAADAVQATGSAAQSGNEAQVSERNGNGSLLTRSGSVLVKAGQSAAARIPLTMEQAKLWDADHPHRYELRVRTVDEGAFTTSLEKEGALDVCDEEGTIFGVRTVTADARCGLRVNGRSVKLKGGCIHHDNGLLGAVSLRDSEYRKIKMMKEAGFNAVRTAHNPPSSVLLEVCDELGMYVFDEAFDAWNIAKQPGDYSQFFAAHWKEDVAAFIRRDRNHPSILFWSTGNEVEERGGMGDGYETARQLAEYVRSLDSTRLVSNGLCSMWSGLDDAALKEQLRQMKERRQSGGQNADMNAGDSLWEEITEPFASCLDVVGYNYLDSHYEYDGEHYPERVIVGTESFPNQIDRVWALVEKLPFVIGDFTWTAWDYIGEAGIGKSAFVEKDDAQLRQGGMALASHTSAYPWRLANDADFTISGRSTPQGVYRRIVWGSGETGLFTQHPSHFGQEELVSMWGWNEVRADWNYEEYKGRPVKVSVYSAADEVELRLNGRSLGRKPAGAANRYTAVFEAPFEAGALEAVSLAGNKELSRAVLETTGPAAALRLTAEKSELCADGESLSYITAELVDAQGRVVPNAAAELTAQVKWIAAEAGTAAQSDAARAGMTVQSGMTQSRAEFETVPQSSDLTGSCAVLAGFGSDAPITEDNYTVGRCRSYLGRATTIVRAGRGAGEAVLTVKADGLPVAACRIMVRA